MVIESNQFSTVQQYQYNGVNIPVDLVADEILVSEKSLEIFKTIAEEAEFPTETRQVPTPFHFKKGEIRNKIHFIESKKAELEKAHDSRIKRIAGATLLMVGIFLITSAMVAGYVIGSLVIPAFWIASVGVFPIYLIVNGLTVCNFFCHIYMETSLNLKLKNKKTELDDLMIKTKEDNNKVIADNYKFYIENEARFLEKINEKIAKFNNNIAKINEIELVEEMQRGKMTMIGQGDQSRLMYETARDDFLRQVAFYKRFSEPQVSQPA